jgi:hypothetical protein
VTWYELFFQLFGNTSSAGAHLLCSVVFCCDELTLCFVR